MCQWYLSMHMSLPDNGLAWLVVLKVLLIDQRRLDDGNNSSSTVITDPIQITCLPVKSRM